MKTSLTRMARRLLGAPFVAGLAVGISATGAGAALLGSSVFPDVPAGSYYDTAVGELNAAGIIKGSNGKFKPGDFVTRAEVAVMMARLRAEVRGETWDEGSTGTQTSSRSKRSSSSSSVSSSSSSSSSSSLAYNPKGAFRFTTTNFTVGEQLNKVTISVVRTGGNEGTAAINYAVNSGTATAGSDFRSASGTLTLSNKETSKTFTIDILDDSTSEGNETFTITLSNPQYGVSLASPSTATVTISDNESGGGSSGASTASTASSAGPTAGTFNLAATAYATKENGSALTVTVLRQGGSQGSVNVNYATTNGTAKSGTDYNGTNGTLTFGAGETSKTFSVTMLDDSMITGNQTFSIALATPTGGSVLGNEKQATVTIYDDESGEFGSGAIKLSKPNYDVTQSEGKATVTVLRTGGANGTVNVTYSATSGTAYSGVDFTATDGTLTFAPGEAAKVFIIPILKTSTLGSERQINITLSNVTSPATIISPYTGTVTIYK